MAGLHFQKGTKQLPCFVFEQLSYSHKEPLNVYANVSGIAG